MYSRAQTAIGGATILDLGLEGQRNRAGFVEPGRIQVHLGVSVDDSLEPAMLLASFTQVHLAITDVDLRVDIHFAYRADRSGELHEHLITVLLHGLAPSLLGVPASLRYPWLG